jgi:hypothetical protein
MLIKNIYEKYYKNKDKGEFTLNEKSIIDLMVISIVNEKP